MTSRDFIYWLQGYFEIHQSTNMADNGELNSKQVDMIKKHLSLVFKHEIDDSYGNEEHIEELNNIHNPQITFPGPPDHLGDTTPRC